MNGGSQGASPQMIQQLTQAYSGSQNMNQGGGNPQIAQMLMQDRMGAVGRSGGAFGGGFQPRPGYGAGTQNSLAGAVSPGYQSPMWQQQRVNPQVQFAAPQVQSFQSMNDQRAQQQAQQQAALEEQYRRGVGRANDQPMMPWLYPEAAGGGGGY